MNTSCRYRSSLVAYRLLTQVLPIERRDVLDRLISVNFRNDILHDRGKPIHCCGCFHHQRNIGYRHLYRAEVEHRAAGGVPAGDSDVSYNTHDGKPALRHCRCRA